MSALRLAFNLISINALTWRPRKKNISTTAGASSIHPPNVIDCRFHRCFKRARRPQQQEKAAANAPLAEANVFGLRCSCIINRRARGEHGPLGRAEDEAVARRSTPRVHACQRESVTHSVTFAKHRPLRSARLGSAVLRARPASEEAPDTCC